MRAGEAAGVEARFMSAGRAFDPGGVGMLRREEFRQHGAEDRKRGHAEQGGEMAGAGVVADETLGRGEGGEQDVGIAERIVEHDDFASAGAQLVGDEGEALGGPAADGVAGAGVDHDAAGDTRG